MTDLIRRADAIEAVQTYLDILINSRRHGDDFTFINVLTDIRNKISALPSAEAVQGEWILVKGSNGKDYHKCSKCLHTQEITGVKNYCAVCGARMKGGDDE